MKRRILISLILLFGVCLLGYAAAMLCLGLTINRVTALAESQRIQWLRANLSTDGVRIQTDLVSALAGHEHAPGARAQNMERFRRSLDRCERCHHPPHLQTQLDSVRDTFVAYRAAADKLFSVENPDGWKALEEKTVALADRFVEKTTNMAELASGHLATRRTDAAAAVRSAWLILSITLLALLLAGGLVALHLQRRLNGPMQALLESVERARNGDVATEFPAHADKEFRQLADAFQQAYGDLRRAKEGVLQAEKLASIGTLASGIAHEVLNPAASISSIAQVMARQTDSDQQKEQARLIISETKRISNVVGELLSFSRPSTSEGYRHLDVAPLLDHAMSLIQYDRRTRNIQMVRQIEPQLPPVHGDPQKLILVFTNIMINALDAMNDGREGPLSLTVAAGHNGKSVKIAFADQGVGMTEAQLASAFDPFFTTKEPDAGTGLGLWICYEIVQRHGGTIHLHSRVGEGTTVTVDLPIPSQIDDAAGPGNG